MSLAASFYTGCGGSSPSRPKGAAGHGGAGVAGGSAGKKGGSAGSTAAAGSSASGGRDNASGGSGGTGGRNHASGGTGAHNDGSGGTSNQDMGGAGAGAGEAAGGAAGGDETGGASGADNATGGTGGSSASGGKAGNGASGGNAGRAGSASMGGAGGRSGLGGASGLGGKSGAGGTSGVAGTSSGGTAGAGGASAGCAKAVFGRYLLRNDGVLLRIDGTTQTPVLDDATGLPLTNVVTAQDGPNHGCASLADKTVKCWQTAAGTGNNAGQLGNGNTNSGTATYRATTVLSAINTPLTDVVALAQGDTMAADVACAVQSGGALYCWGNLIYVLNGGVALVSSYAVPVTTNGITPLDGVFQVSLAGSYACATRHGSSSNEVWCWGDNSSKNLGQGDTTARKFPTKVSGLTNPTAVLTTRYTNLGSVSVPTATTCALDGTNVRCWGSARTAGTGGPADSSGAVVSGPTLVVIQDGVTALPDVIDIQGGNGAFCGRRNDNSLWCWGGTAANYGISNVTALGASTTATLQILPRFLTSDGVYHQAMTTLTPNCAAL